MPRLAAELFALNGEDVHRAGECLDLGLLWLVLLTSASAAGARTVSAPSDRSGVPASRRSIAALMFFLSLS
ncbi:hypothetical protein [Streptomyces griseus]|uniref:hypothetical protein n=1 Tax=Streptomyces griseus TaxID=1911 RepID=UPI00055CF74F|nr:hypothetical protein [Streptomyces griseus]